MDSSLSSQDQSPAVHTLSVNRNLSSPHQPSNDDIEAVIQAAMSARPSPARDTRTQLFVGNLPYRVRWQDLKDLFRRAGTVLRADVSLGADNRSRGYGTVLLATAEDAGRAIDMFNGYSWQTRILEVRHDRLPPSDFDAPAGTLSSASAGPGTLSRHHSTLNTGQYPSIDEISDAHGLFNPYQSHDGSLGPSGTSSRNLFVGNLPFHCQWQDLKDLFRGSGGTILRADVALGPDGRSRGFGTVVFANDYDAENALRMFDGYEYNGRSLKVHYDKFSAVGQNSATGTPSIGMAPHIHLSHPHPRLPTAGFRLPISPLAQSAERAEPSPFDLYASEQQVFLSQQAQAQQRLSSLSPVPPRPAAGGAASRSGSTSTASSSNPTAFDMESIATSLSSISSHQGRSASSLSGKPGSHGSPAHNPAVPAERKSSRSQPYSPQRAQSHPHHPGTITLPPPAPLPPFPQSPTHSMGHVTPVHSPHHAPPHHQYPQFTPHGLPPMTPSMPAFYFPQPSPHGAPIYYQAVHTPTGIALAYGHPLASASTPMATPPIPNYLPLQTPPIHMTAPSQMFSPMSPGSFWAGGTVNPAINPTVGAPVRKNSEDHSGTDARPSEATGYFDMPIYFGNFPPPPHSGPSGSHHVGSPEDSQPLDDPRYYTGPHPESAVDTPEESPSESNVHISSRAQSMSEDVRPVPPGMRRNGSDPNAPTIRSNVGAADHDQ